MTLAALLALLTLPQEVAAHGAIGFEFSPPDAIADLEVVSYDGSTVVLTWTAPSDDDPSEPVMLYEVQASTSPTFVSFESWGDLIPDAPGMTEVLEIEGLEGGRLHFRVASRDEGFVWSPWSNIVETPDLPTPDPDPSPEPSPGGGAQAGGDGGGRGGGCSATGQGTALLLAALAIGGRARR